MDMENRHYAAGGINIPQEILDKKLAKDIRFLESLMRMNEEPQEIRYFVRSTSKKSAGRAKILIAEHGHADYRGDLILLVSAFFSYVFLLPRKKRFTFETISKSGLSKFFDLVNHTGFDLNLHSSFSGYRMLKWFYFTLREIGYCENVEKQANILKTLEKTAARYSS